ncbi:porin [Vibrio alfacsensis]|uniref:porin n=1 Tax=Vibrio alfacsensis TaxID=1074311 RepID=UPI002ADD4451|nr:porin [Vibrio alfacsensis]WQE77654.1 porin [Vibrio alfacsensis]
MKINMCSAAIIGCLSLSATAQAVEISTPEFYGSVRAQAAFQEGNDYTTDIYQAEAGLVGFVPVYDFNLRYQLEAEYSESMPKLNAKGEKADDNDLIVREANIIMMSKKWGGTFIGSGTTGTWADLYSKIDIFESNNMERHSDNLLFGGKRYSTNQFALITPHFGPFHFKAAIVSPDEHNDEDADILGLRALYNQGNFSLVVNQSLTSKEMLGGAEEDSQRTIVATSYNWDQLYLGAVAEFDYDAPFGKRNVYGISGKYTYGDTSMSLGYQFADWKDANRDDESLVIANVNHKFNAHFSVFAETAFYGEESTAPETSAKGDNVNLGLIVSF